MRELADAGTLLYPEGMKACSRWSSEERATPPVNQPPNARTPEGCQHPRYAIHSHLLTLSHSLLHEKPGTYHYALMETSSSRIPRRRDSRPGRNSSRHRRDRGSHSYPGGAYGQPLSGGFHARVEEGILCLGERYHSRTRVSLAGRLRRIYGERLIASCRPAIHWEPGRTSSEADLPRGIDRVSGEIRHRIRGVLPRLDVIG